MSVNETEVVKKIYAAINQNDIPEALSFFDSQAERVESESFPMPGTYRGLSELTAHFSQGRSTWAEGGCHPDRLVSAGDKVAVVVHVKVRLKNKTDWIDAHIGDVFTFKNGKAIEMRSFISPEEAFAWAGIKQ